MINALHISKCGRDRDIKMQEFFERMQSKEIDITVNFVQKRVSTDGFSMIFKVIGQSLKGVRVDLVLEKGIQEYDNKWYTTELSKVKGLR